MDPVSILVMAIVIGAAAGLKSAAEISIKDAYNSLRELIKRRYSEVDIEQIEQNPSSEQRRALLKAELTQIEAIQNKEVLERAQAVLDATERMPELAEQSNITIEKVKAANVRLKDMIASGSFSAREIETTGDVDISGIRAGYSDDSDPKKA
jgi:predicted nucleotidyltransferase